MYNEYTVYAVKRIWRALGSLSVKYSQSCLSHLQLALSSYNQQCETYNPGHHCWNTDFWPPLLMFTRYMSKQKCQTNIEGKQCSSQKILLEGQSDPYNPFLGARDFKKGPMYQYLSNMQKRRNSWKVKEMKMAVYLKLTWSVPFYTQ